MRFPRLHAPRHATVAAYLALALSLSGGAYAATGGTFKLGYTNSANQSSTLTNTGSGPALKIGTKASAPPISVSSKVKVARLNADLLDGKDSSAFTLSAFTSFTMLNGWTAGCYTGAPGYARLGSMVVLHGDTCGGSTSNPAFTLPASIRPSQDLYLTVDECNAATGRLYVDHTTGDVYPVDDPAASSSGCFVSLSGVFYTLPY